MPAGKIVKVAYKRKARKSSNFKKAVTAIAKKAVMTQSETRTAQLPVNQSFGINGFLQPIWTNISQGNAEENRDGDEIRTLGVRIRGLFYQNTAIITALNDFNVIRMVVASGKRPLTSGDFPTFKGTIDNDVMTVLSDTYITFATTSRQRSINKYIKFNRKVLYQGGSVNKNELYFWFVPIGGTGLTTSTGDIVDVTFQPYFKDL